MVPPLLKLAFFKGPRDGETLEYNPGSTIRIGRIVRGNDIAIKDAGISTKHLRIESGSQNWVIQDLGSSNGTLLNSNPLDPDAPVNLRHDDIIKLGEYTSIVVNFVNDVQESGTSLGQKLPSRTRRTNRRQDRANSEENSNGYELRKRTRASGNRIQEDIVEEERVLYVEDENKLINKGRKHKSSANSCFDGEKVGIADIVVKEEECLEEKKRVNRKATRSKKIKIVEESCLRLGNVERNEIAAAGASKEALMEKDEKRNSRATRNKKDKIVEDSHLKLEMDLNQARKSRAKNKKEEQMPLKSSKVAPTKDRSRKDEQCDVEKGADLSSAKIVSMDLEKMTLEAWFRFLELHLPKQINNDTEKMIQPMRSKIQRVHKHIAEQKQIKAAATLC